MFNCSLFFVNCKSIYGTNLLISILHQLKENFIDRDNPAYQPDFISISLVNSRGSSAENKKCQLFLVMQNRVNILYGYILCAFRKPFRNAKEIHFVVFFSL